MATLDSSSQTPVPVVIKRRKRRWWLRIPLILLAFVVTVIVLVQALLWSDLPRSIAEQQVQQIVGVRTSIESVSISWFGDTRIKGVKLTLPMANEPFLTVDSIRANHTSLPLIAFAQDIKSVRIEGVRAKLIEEPTGRWNVEQLLSTGRAARPVAPSNSSPARTLEIPDVDVTDVVVSVQRNNGKSLELSDIVLKAQHTSPLDYTFDATAGGFVVARGQIALAGPLDHDVAVEVADLPQNVRDFVGTLPKPLSANLKWTGRRTPTGVTGTLAITDAAAEDAHANGLLDIRTTENGVVVEPRELVVKPQGDRGIKLALLSGSITAGEKVIVDNVRGRLDEGRFAINGEFDGATRAGRLTAAWEAVRRDSLVTTGTATVTSRLDFTGNTLIDLDASGTAELPDGKASGAIKIAAIVPDGFDKATATLVTRPLTWQPTQGDSIAVPELAGRLVFADSKLDLLSLQPISPDTGSLRAAGHFDLKAESWWATLDTAALRVPQLEAQGLRDPLTVHFDAYGSLQRVTVKQLYAAAGRAVIFGKGFYVASDPEPLRLDTWAWYDPQLPEGEDRVGGMTARGLVAGTLQPCKLVAKGLVDAAQLTVRGRKIGDVTIDVEANVTENRAEVRSKEIELFGGNWKLSGDWTAFSKQPPIIVIDWRNVPAARLAELAKQENIEGLIDTGKLTIKIPSTDLRELEATAVITAQRLRRDPVIVDTLRLDATLKNGQIVAKPVLQRGDGTITAEATVDLNDKALPVKLDATLEHWPAPTVVTSGPAADLKAEVSGKVDASGVVTRKTFEADVKLTGAIDRTDGQVGSFDLDASALNTRLNLNSFNLQTLDGTAYAEGSVDLKDLEKARFVSTFDKLAPSELAWVNPALADVNGRFSGGLNVHPETAPRARGPVKIDFNVTGDGAGFRTIDFTSASLNANGGYQSAGDFRVVTNTAEIIVAGGKIKPSLRISADATQGLSQYVSADLEELDLTPIVRAFKDDGKVVVGRVSGTLTAIGRTQSLGTLTALANIQLSKADLTNFKPVEALENRAGKGGSNNDPTGTGSLELRVERGILTISNVSYQGGGLDIRGFGSVSKLDELPASPVDLTLIALLRPLADIDLPFFEDASSVLDAFQGNSLAVRQRGALDNLATPEFLPLSELGNSFSKIILGRGSSSQAK